MRDQVQFPQLDLFWHTPAAYTDGDAEVRLIASLLGGGESSRLYRALVVPGLAQEVSVQQSPTKLGDYLVIEATAMEGVPLDRIEGVIFDQLRRLATEAPAAAEMERLKNQFEYGFERAAVAAPARRPAQRVRRLHGLARLPREGISPASGARPPRA